MTGCAGRIGRAVCAELLARGHRVRGFDRVRMAGLTDQLEGNLASAGEVERAVAGVDTVVHLAATPDEDDFLTRLLPDNVIGLYHVLEQARRARVGRVILASTGQVMRGHAGALPITLQTPPAPRNWYSSTKLFAEAAGQSYAHLYGMSVIVVRCGWCPRTRRDVEALEASEYGKNSYLSPGDAGRCFAGAVEASQNLKFAIVFATSRPVDRPRYDLGPTRELLGFEPRDRWPEGLDPGGMPE